MEELSYLFVSPAVDIFFCFTPIDIKIIESMRLLNTKTFDVEDFDSPEKIKYAILSHRWVDGKELKFEALQDPAILDRLRLAKPETVSHPKSPVSKAE